MLQATQRFIEYNIDDIELNRWKELHNQLHQVSELVVHIDFIKTMLEADLISVTPNYNLDQLNKDLDIISNMTVRDFSEPIKEGSNLYLYLKNDQIAIAISNILKATHYFDEQDFINTVDKDIKHNLYIRLENIYNKAYMRGHLYGEAECYASVNLQTRVDNLASDKGLMHFDCNKDNANGDLQFPVNTLFESNIYRAMAKWLCWYIFAE